MAVAGRPEDTAVVRGASLLLSLRVYREGDTPGSEACRT